MKELIIKIVHELPGNAIELTQKEMLMIPCHYLIAHEYEEKLIVIKYKPDVTATDEQIALVHLKALSRKYKIHSWEILEKLEGSVFDDSIVKNKSLKSSVK